MGETLDESSLDQTAVMTLPPGATLIDELLVDSGFDIRAPEYEPTRDGVVALITEALVAKGAGFSVSRGAVDVMIAEIDERLTAQINAILHREKFQRLESMWRSLRFVIDRVDVEQNVKIEFTNINRDDLQEDLDDAPLLTKSGFFALTYSKEYGQFGGEPYGLICGAYEFDTSARDLALLKSLASVSAMAHAPFLGNVGASFFGFTDLEAVTQLQDLKSIMDAPQFTKWQAFREAPDACYIGLCMPRFLLRTPYDERATPMKGLNFIESTDDHDSYVWGHASNAMATRVADSFAKYRWCPNIIGPQSGGTVTDLPLHDYGALTGIQMKIPTEVMLTEKREFELSEEGLIALTFRKDSDDACFFSANSVQKPKFFGSNAEAKGHEVNHRLGTQLPYMFIVTRLAHYIKVIQREQLGGYKTRQELEREINAWLSNYIADMDNPNMRVRAARPLRKARVYVEDVEGQAGWFKCRVDVQPHMKYMGASFTLSLVGRLDK